MLIAVYVTLSFFYQVKCSGRYDQVEKRPTDLRLLHRCPTTLSVPEILPVQKCVSDTECGSRLCCPSGRYSYCRTAAFDWKTISVPKSLIKIMKRTLMYIQCTSPPPLLLSWFPAQSCKNSLDCFPNLCCQEKGKKVCRPARKSFIPLLTVGNLL